MFFLLALALHLSLPSPQSEATIQLAPGWTPGRTVEAEEFAKAPKFPVEDDLGRSLILRADRESGKTYLYFMPISARYVRRSPLHRDLDLGLPVLDESGMPWGLPESAIDERRNLHVLPITNEKQVALLLCEPRDERIRQIDLRVEREASLAVTNLSVFACGIERGTFTPYWIRGSASGDLVVTTPQGSRFLTPTGSVDEETDLMTKVHRLQAAASPGPLDADALLAALASDLPDLRAAAVRAFESQLPEATGEVMSGLMGALKGGGETYARQLACSLGEIAGTPGGIRGLCVLMTRRAKDEWLRLAVRSGLEGQELEMLRVLIGMRSWQENKPGRFDGTRELAGDIVHSGRRLELQQLLDIALNPKRQSWHVDAIARAFGVPEDVDAPEALRRLRAKSLFASAELRKSFQKGQETYESSCIECHRPSGYGYALRGPNGRVAEGPEGLKGLRKILAAPKHEGLELAADLQDLHRYLRLEWQPLRN